MADPEPNLIRAFEDFPTTQLPTIFVDGALSASPGRQVIKIYFGRIDPNIKANGTEQVLATLQLIMPIDALIQTAQFMTNIVDNMILEGKLSKEDVERMRALAGAKKDEG